MAQDTTSATLSLGLVATPSARVSKEAQGPRSTSSCIRAMRTLWNPMFWPACLWMSGVSSIPVRCRTRVRGPGVRRVSGRRILALSAPDVKASASWCVEQLCAKHERSQEHARALGCPHLPHPRRRGTRVWCAGNAEQLSLLPACCGDMAAQPSIPATPFAPCSRQRPISSRRRASSLWRYRFCR